MRSALFLLVLLCAILSQAQQNPEILMTVGSLEITDQEFVQVYNKNLNLVQDEQQRSIDGYLDLFVDYKLKVAEAYSQGLDTMPNYIKELGKYEDQLARNYIYEDRLTEDLIKEAYQRGLEELNVDHILIMVGLNSLPQDTLTAYNKIQSIRDKATKGEDFNKLARQYSEEPGAKQQAGQLGYISVFSTVYPFETAAYSTEVGTVSQIVRTQFGYHILKVNERRDKSPDLLVSHIMVADRQDAGTVDPQERINEIFALYQQGEEFEALAKQYSDDKGSARNGGQLRPFGRGSLRSKKFENRAYQLDIIGEVSDPFQSEFGWHIVRLDSVIGVKSFDQQRENISARIAQGNRAQVIEQNLVDRTKQEYGFERRQSYFQPAMSWVTDSVMNRKWVMTALDKTQNPVLFVIGDKEVRLQQYGQYLESRQKRIKLPVQKGELLTQVYFEFEQIEVEQFLKDRLELDNQEYALVVNEYREGLLIFEVMNNSVWKQARTDSVGLEQYYHAHKENYLWKDRLDAEVFNATDQQVLMEVERRLKEGQSADQIREAINTDDRIQLIYNAGIFEQDDKRFPSDFKIKEGISDILTNTDNFVLINGKELVPAGPKSLDEARGQVLSDYQSELEKNWMEQLRNKYPVEVDQKVFKRLKLEN